MTQIRLLVAEDETVVRYALAQLLGAEDDIEIVAEAPNGEAAVALARDREPDVVLMDLQMPKMDGIAATRQIKEDLPGRRLPTRLGIALAEPVAKATITLTIAPAPGDKQE